MRATRIKKILFSQHPPANFDKSPYADFVTKYNVKVDFYKFFHVAEVPLKSFLSQNVSVLDYKSVILTSKNATDYFFHIVKKAKINYDYSTAVKYFCCNEMIADNLEKYLYNYMRKIFFSDNGSLERLVEELLQYPEERFLLPMAMDSTNNQLVKLLDENNINYTKAEVFKISFPEVKKDVDIYSYNMLVFFSPYGIQNLFRNYPDFKQGNMAIGVFGTLTLAAAREAGLEVQIIAPTSEHSSIFSAVDKYLKKANSRQYTYKKTIDL